MPVNLLVRRVILLSVVDATVCKMQEETATSVATVLAGMGTNGVWEGSMISSNTIKVLWCMSEEVRGGLLPPLTIGDPFLQQKGRLIPPQQWPQQLVLP